jgi:hypothetical protein
MAADETDPSDSGDTWNVHDGRSQNVVQAGSIHGSVIFTRDRRVAIAILLAALVVAAAVVFAGGSESAEPALAPVTTEVPADPLLVASLTGDYMCENDWVTHRPPDQLSLPPDSVTKWSDWDLVSDGVAAESGLVTLTVHGTGPNSVVLTGMSVTVERAPPMTGTRLTKPCGGPEYMRLVEIDLDEPDPHPTGQDLSPRMLRLAAENGWRSEPVRFPYEVSAQDSESFAVMASTSTCDCAWTLEVHWSSGGRSGTTVVDDNGHPFRVTATSTGTPRCSLIAEPLPCEVG